MAAPSVPLSLSGLTFHSWNADNSQIALSPNSNAVQIFDTNGSVDDSTKWKKAHDLEGHSGFVSGIDWSPVSNLIVTAGHDRNAYVWKQEANGDWTPTLVILRIQRAATSVKWSPKGNKFAVTSGAKCVPVCHFEESNNWWISKMIKKHKSTVTCIDWCPNNKFVVTGATDFKCRVFSAYIKDIDPPEDDGFGEVWANQHKFGEVLVEFDQAKSWINAVTWSPNGFRLAFAGHASSLHFVQLLAGQKPVVQNVYLKGLPFTCAEFLNDEVVVACGFDRTPVTFVAGGSAEAPEWAFKEELDKPEEKKESAAGPKKKSAFAGARAMFAASADQGNDFGKNKKSKKMLTKHKNYIQSVQKMNGGAGATTSLISTAGIDGRLLVWDLNTLNCDKAAYGL